MIRPGKVLGMALQHLFKKPATELYPFVKKGKCDKFRGRIEFYPEKCIGCKFCMRDCPANAITINKIADKQFECVMQLDKCIYCAQCVDVCPKKALASTKDFELAQLTKDKLKETYAAEKKEAPVEQTPAPAGEGSQENAPKQP